MKALILAAGRGSRMRELTADQPKCLVQLGDRPLLAWQLRALRSAGLGPIGIVTGYCHEALDGLAEHSFHNPHWQHTNMVASLACAAPWLEQDDVLVSYSDIFYASRTVKQLAASPSELAISHDPQWLALWQQRFTDPLSDAESFRADASGRLLDIGRRVRELSEIQGQYMGLIRISPPAWKRIRELLAHLEPAARDRLDMTSLLQALLARDMPIHVVANTAPWGEVDSESDLELYRQQLRSGILDLERLTGEEST